MNDDRVRRQYERGGMIVGDRRCLPGRQYPSLFLGRKGGVNRFVGWALQDSKRQSNLVEEGSSPRGLRCEYQWDRKPKEGRHQKRDRYREETARMESP